MSRKTKASLGIAISSIAAVGGIMTPQTALAEEVTGATAQPQAACQNVTVAESDLGQQATEAKQAYDQAQSKAEADTPNVTNAKTQKDAADTARDAAKTEVDNASKAVTDAGNDAQQAIDSVKQEAKDTADADADAADKAQQSATDAQTAKDDADAKASDAQHAANDAQQAADAANSAAQGVTDADVNDAQHAADTAKAQADADAKTQDDAQRAVDEATNDKAQAASDAKDAQDNVADAEKSLDEAKDAQKTAQSAVDDANKSLDTAKASVDKSPSDDDISNAKDAVDSAKEQLDAAKSAADAAVSDEETAKESAKKSQSESDAIDAKAADAAKAQTSVNAAQKAVDEAQAAKDAADASMKAAQDALAKATEDAQATDDYKSAQKTAQSAQSDLDWAMKGAASEQAEVDAAQAAQAEDIAKIKAAIEAAGGDWDAYVRGIRGFYESVGATDAINILDHNGFSDKMSDGLTHSDYTHEGTFDDATSLLNFRRALEVLKAENETRAKWNEWYADKIANGDKFTDHNRSSSFYIGSNTYKKIGDYKVSDLAMAISEDHINWTDEHYKRLSTDPDHVRDSYFARYVHAGNAGSAYQPFEVMDQNSEPAQSVADWFNERINEDAYAAGTPEKATDNGGNTGHYYICINQKEAYCVMGAAIGDGYSTALDFIGPKNYGGSGTAYTVDEYIERFMAYYNKVTGGADITTYEDDYSDKGAIITTQSMYKAQYLNSQAKEESNKAAAEEKMASIVSDATADETAAVEAATKDVEEAQSALDAANSKLAVAKAALDAAPTQDEIDAAHAARDAANEALKTASANVTSTKSALAAAQSAYDTAKSTYDTLVQARAYADSYAKAEAARQQLESAKQALSDAEAAQSDANGKLADATAAQKSASDAYDAAKDATAAAQASVDAAKAAVDVAQKAYDNAASGSSKAAFEDTDTGKAAAQSVTDVQAKLSEANATLSSAQSALDAANAALVKALDGTGVTQAMIDAIDANETLANSSYGFFEWLGNVSGDKEKNATALKYLTDASWTGNEKQNGTVVGTFLRYTHLGSEDDATSLKHLGDAIKLVAASNQYRANDPYFTGRQPLKVSTLLMALAEINANWNGRDGKQESAHAINVGETNRLWAYGENQAMRGSTAKSGAYWSNLAYDESDGDDYGTNKGAVDWDTPYDAWYLAERYDWIQQNVLKDTSNTKNTGHYTNLMGWAQNGITGVAVSEYQNGTWYDANAMQEFSYANSPISAPDGSTISSSGLGVYDVDEFQKLYDQYVSVLNARTSAKQAQEAVATAQKAYDDAKSAADTAQSELDAAQKAYDDAKSAYGTTVSQDDVDKAKAALDEASSKLADANDVLSKAQSNESTAKAALDDANATLASAKDAVADAETGVTSAQEAVDAAQKAYDQAAGSIAETPVAKAQAAYDTAKAALDDANANLAAAQKAYDDAKSAADDATARQDDAQKRLDNAKQALSDATSKAADSDATYKDALAKYERLAGLVSAKDDAESKLSDAKDALDKAKQDVADADEALAEAKKACADAAAKASDSAAAYDAVKDYTVDDALAGKPGMPDSVISAVKDAMRRKADAQDRLATAQEAYEQALAKANDADAAYDDVLAKHLGLESDALSAKARYLAILEQLARQQRGTGTASGHGAQSSTRNAAYDATGRRSGMSPYRVLGERTYGNAIGTLYGQRDYIAPAVSESVDSSDNGADAEATGNASEKPVIVNGDSSDKRQDSTNASKPDNADAGTRQDDNDGMPLIITAVIGGIVVVTVVAAGLYHAAKDKERDEENDATDAK